MMPVPDQAKHRHSGSAAALTPLDAPCASLDESSQLDTKSTSGPGNLSHYPHAPAKASRPNIPSISNLTSLSSIDGKPTSNESPSAVCSPPWPDQYSHSPAFDEAIEKAALANSRSFPLQDVQEACLFRYFVEQISHWFDLCDEYRHFELVVPLRARQYPHLLDAMFAVAARHLSRMPQYKTDNGIQYNGYTLPCLGDHVAVEYMLKCIPPLRQFHDSQDSSDYLDSIIATAVILRQFEEIDHEDNAAADHDPRHQPHTPEKKVNFLAIIDSVLRSLPTDAVFGGRSLMQASYWMALRQEIYNSFTRKEPPRLILPLYFWHISSGANKIVMHLVQAAQWRWGGGSDTEYLRLVRQQQDLEDQVLTRFCPIYSRPADKSRGEIFPASWYASNVDTTTSQLGLIAKAFLIAENPFMTAGSAASEAASRAQWRKSECQVRTLLLQLCGVALSHTASPPALIQAVLGIGLYGDFFIDNYERQAIRSVVERTRDTHAWPVHHLLEMFK
ncbi:hypothetical protein CDD81_7593 [Ophiocordyceps australis]|uniref:ARCA protein n=1 Tax=Ophiocordyceps australis TaxID=1399860 RepID=A0A2C5Y3V9_9HYPO|nr:hypothetical protein CDD81_7593 [Ophiocordyceps australis]